MITIKKKIKLFSGSYRNFRFANKERKENARVQVKIQ